MPPPGGNKRKRPDRTYSDDQQAPRPSPHRPGNLNLAHQGPQSPGNDRDFSHIRGGRNSRRPSRGGRGGNVVSSAVNSPVDNPDSASTIPNPEPNHTNGTMDTPPNIGNTPFELSEAPSALQPFNYIYVTDEAIASWQGSGKDEVLRKALEELQEVERTKLTAIMHELVESVIYGRINPSDAGQLVKEILDTEKVEDDTHSALTPTDSQATLLDCISILFDANPELPKDRLAVFLLATNIAHELLRLELDAAVLEKLELIRNTFNRVLIRKQTNILYRQANFNLMREESEGFAKLITELFTTSNNEPPTAEVVEDTVEKVKAMIGAFDLDVGRSLDVVLDVFGAVLVKQFRFFVKFLRASPWWPRQTVTARKASAIGGLPLWALPGSTDWHLTDEQRQLVAKEAEARDSTFWQIARQQGLKAFHHLGRPQISPEQLDRASEASGDDLWAKWVRETGTMPPLGNRDAAQLLGFKLRFYSSSAARDEADVLPDNLIYLAALLIKIGFISLKDLYPHIWRTDDAMEELKQQKTKEKAERERSARPGAGAKNALLMAGALADDTLPIPARLKDSNTRASTPSKEVDADKATPKESNGPADQKVLLLKSLLAIGALPEALFILGKFPWLMELYPDLPEYINRILHQCLSKIYGAIRPLQDRSTLRNPAPCYETDIPGLQKGQVKVVDTTEKKTLRWPLLDKSDSADGTNYRFYWDEWNDNIPICQSVDDLFTLTETLLPLVGVKIGQDPILLLKFARIGKHSLHTDRSEFNRARWLDLSKRILLPALSLTKSNAGVVNEVFELISNFPVSVRYLLYVEWSSGKTSRNPDIKAAFDQAKAETKDILKRISNTNVRPMARALAKIAFANPHIVITTALPQIEVYDSIAEVFVEGARYFTDLGYDILTWAVVSSMARTGRDRIQEGGMFTSKWLIALSQFAGKIYKRYGMMRPGPVLQYVVEQLEQGKTADLKMLEQIVASMGGIATDTSYNDAQLQAMGGGPLLQAQTILQVLDRRHDSKKTSERLMKSLHDTGLAAKFLIALAQQRQACVFDQGDVPLKAMGNTYDEVQRVMVQYLDLLRYNLSTEEFASVIPDVTSLLIDYEVRPEVAFWISRPIIAKQMQDFDRENKSQQADGAHDLKGINGDTETSDQLNGGISEEDGEAQEVDDMHDSPADTSTPGLGLEPESASKLPGLEAPVGDCWHPVMKEVMASIEPHLPEEVVEIIGTGFYTTFWQLALYDITIPGKSYEDEISRQKKKIAAIASDRSDVSASGTRKKELAKKELTELMDRLLAENKDHLKAFSDSKAKLQREKDKWFLGKARMDKLLNASLMEHCFLPRLLSSPLDAYFCFKFVKFLHGAGTPNFRTLGFYDLLFKPARLTSLIFICTSKESDNLGRFLNEILKDLGRWHAAKQTYEREGWGIKKNLPGFALKVEAGKVVSLLDFDSFRRVLYKWHSNLFHALVKCLTSPEYMHVRNAISVLRSISMVFPAINSHGVGLQKAVDKLGESDKEDLKVSSQALLGALHRREKLWMTPSKFRDGHDANSESEQIASQPKAIGAKPSATVAKPVTNAGEDGEVKDTIMTDAPEQPRASDEQESESEAAAKSIPAEPVAKPEPAIGSPKPISRAAPTQGSSTPSRQVVEPQVSGKREPRPVRSDVAKPNNLPRRLSPPTRGPPPAHLPSRPEPPDLRNGQRDSPRLPTRQLGDLRTGPDTRPSHSRDVRSGYRGPESATYDEYDRHPRRYDTREGPLPISREDRGYAREREHERPPPPYERPRPLERAAPPVRPPPGEREREPRDSASRTRPSGPPEVAALENPSQKSSSQRKEPPSQSTAAPSINPERAALIEGSNEPRLSLSTRVQMQDRPSRSSRPSSPRREEERRTYPRRENEDRSLPDRRADLLASRSSGPTSGTISDSLHGPTPRSGPRDSTPRESKSLRQPPVDMQHGRLEQEPPARPLASVNVDRAPASDVPSGPRTRPPPLNGPKSGRGPQVDTQLSPPGHGERPTPTGHGERPTPTGPSARRHGRTSSYNEAPVTPNTPDSTGVHPSRLNQIDAATTEGPRPNPAPTLPLQAPPPAGPRGQPPPGAPSGPSPTTRAPPAGPHMGDGGAGRGGRNNRHPLTAVNNTLAQAGQGTSIRGRGGSSVRQGSGTFGSHMQPPPPPPPPGGPPPPNGYASHQDLFASSNPNELPVGNRPSATRHTNSRDRRSDYDNDRGSERRPTRHSGRQEDIRGDRDHQGRPEAREGKDERHGPPDASRHRERSSRRDEHGQGQEGEDRRGGGGGYARSGPQRDDQSTRKHGRGEDPPSYGGGPGAERGGGSSGRGGSRAPGDNKRPRRGP
ncbi:uncharacterized protein A1O9_02033 [Exophiala aquamarina CBS 119918]|uniref:THO complex subunit 2 n=1 Tax=Exophiala aquamarina CBS 119918 TaxID=1182545 RepID=A0A072PL40_9EURO|nr:uncharacterized protein A1O9_02033 [Exophiala aquamarina CBS 119918]KEF60472.1 hypothetical protein A1O9_02033 [Exophiala aquamarina CBS 119918]